MVTLGTLTPFWITFTGDRPEGFPLGFGVTAWSETDAWRLLDELGYDQHRRAAVDVKTIATVDEIPYAHVRQHMSLIVVRGVWYPFTRAGTD